MLVIKITNARNLASSWSDTIDPYVKMEYNGAKKESTVKDDNENPDWNEEFTYDLDPSQSKITLKLMDSDTFSDSEYAHVDVDLSPALGGNAMKGDAVPLLDESGKTIQGTLTYSIEVVVIRNIKFHLVNARKLASSWSDTIDPYIKISYHGQEQKSQVIDDNENPDFNQDISFKMVPGVTTAKLMLMDSNLISDSEYGHVDVDLSSSVASGENVEMKDHALKDSENKDVQGSVSFNFIVEGGDKKEAKGEVSEHQSMEMAGP